MTPTLAREWFARLTKPCRRRGVLVTRIHVDWSDRRTPQTSRWNIGAGKRQIERSAYVFRADALFCNVFTLDTRQAIRSCRKSRPAVDEVVGAVSLSDGR